MKERIENFKNGYQALKARFIKVMEKPVKVMKVIFGYGIMTSLLLGGLTLLGFIVAFCVGGEGAAAICAFIKKYAIPAVTYMSTVMVVFGLVIMYLSGEVALAAEKKSSKKASQKDSVNLEEGER